MKNTNNYSKKVIVILGGNSEEREVSLVTGEQVAASLENKEFNVIQVDPQNFNSYSDFLNKLKKEQPYIVFNALHGKEGEDGKIQALFELENIPYTGSDHLSSTVAMDKQLSNILATSLQIPVAKFISLNKQEKPELNLIKKEIGFPLVVKPNNSGSSFGIHIVENIQNLNSAISNAFNYGNQILIQEYTEGREITVTILANEALPVVEIAPKKGWYNYKNKYTKGKTNYIVPAKLPETETQLVKKYALDFFQLIKCRSYARVDFRYDGHNFYFLELNTLPGMTPLSLTPMAAKNAGYSFGELLVKIIESSLNQE